jgi:hypothetical protein
MTDDGPEPRMGDTVAVAVGPKEVGGPAGIPDAVPAPHHHLTFLAAHSGRTGPGYRQRLDERAPSGSAGPDHPGPGKDPCNEGRSLWRDVR